MIRSILIHLSMNMWEDLSLEAVLKRHKDVPSFLYDRMWSDQLRFDENVWNNVLDSFSASGGNMIILDVGDGVQFRSHPEISVNGAWSCKQVATEVKRCKDLGIELIPKLNFSACHDAWLHEYSRMLSTKKYYEVCTDLIQEIGDMFCSPRFLHIGMDEETQGHQKYYEYVTARTGNLWWHDLNFYAETCQKFGMRPWMWSDKIWHTSDEEYSQNVPRYILQSNWDYGNDFKKHLRNDGIKGFPDIVEAYFRLERLGYDQVPTASNWAKDENYEEMVRHLSKMLSPDRLFGYMQTPWKPTLRKYKQDILQSISLMEEAHRLNPDACWI